MNRLLLAAALLVHAAMSPVARAEAPASKLMPPHAPVFIAALPAAVSFVAWLPVDKQPDLVDLDVRVEVVLPHGCGDTIAGLLRHDGPRLEGDDDYDVVVRRNAVGECKKDAVRIGDRASFRFRVADGQTRTLTIGGRTIKVARQGKTLTLDGEEAGGDVPGAPATAPPSTLVYGEVASASVLSARRIAGTPDSTDVDLQVSAKWPTCAGPPLGLLGRGDAETHFALARFLPLARAPFDAPCKGTATRAAPIRAVIRVPHKEGQLAITVGATPLTVKPAAAPAATPASSAPGAKPAKGAPAVSK